MRCGTWRAAVKRGAGSEQAPVWDEETAMRIVPFALPGAVLSVILTAGVAGAQPAPQSAAPMAPMAAPMPMATAMPMATPMPMGGAKPMMAPAPMPPLAQQVPDPAWKVPEVLAFAHIRAGDRVAEVVSGRLTAAIARAVGPTGHVYALETAELAGRRPEAVARMRELAATMGNMTVTADPVMTPLPGGLDVVFIRENYHDLYDKFVGPADVAAFNRNVYAALKPGGVFVVLDHAAAPGADISSTETLHRIDPARVKADMAAAGFRFDGESAILANPADPHTARVMDPSIRGHTDLMLLRFRKPR